MGQITLTTFLLQEVLWQLRALLVVLVPLSGCGVLVGEIKEVWLCFVSADLNVSESFEFFY